MGKTTQRVSSTLVAAWITLSIACATAPKASDKPRLKRAKTREQRPIVQAGSALLAGTSWAVAYSGYRRGQHPDRGQGAKNPTRAQLLEDLKLLARGKVRLIRLYDSGEVSRQVLELIRQHKLDIRVMLGVGCAPRSATTKAVPG
jgi:hypothetical protein